MVPPPAGHYMYDLFYVYDRGAQIATVIQRVGIPIVGGESVWVMKYIDRIRYRRNMRAAGNGEIGLRWVEDSREVSA